MCAAAQSEADWDPPPAIPRSEQTEVHGWFSFPGAGLVVGSVPLSQQASLFFTRNHVLSYRPMSQEVQTWLHSL